MILTDTDIQRAVSDGTLTISDFDPQRLQPASYDIQLGNTFELTDENVTHYIDPAEKIFARTREISVADGEQFVLHPGVSVLGTSKDYFGSDTYLIQLHGKSSLARIGLLVHNTAGLINPGHFLHITFELCNLNKVPIILRPGMAIGQLTFSPLSSAPQQNYRETGRYAEDNWDNYRPPREA